MTDYTPEEKAAVWARAQAAIASVDEMKARWANKDEPLLRGSGFPVVEPRQPAWSPPPPGKAPEPEPHTDHWASWTRWAEGVNARLAKTLTTDTMDTIAEGVGEAVGTLQKEERRSRQTELKVLEDRIAKDAEATVSLLMEMERRLADLEQRAVVKTKPRLIGGSDAA